MWIIVSFAFEAIECLAERQSRMFLMMNYIIRNLVWASLWLDSDLNDLNFDWNEDSFRHLIDEMEWAKCLIF